MSRVRIFNETDELHRAAAERIAHLSQLVAETPLPRAAVPGGNIHRCAEIMFLAIGAAKAHALAAALEGPPEQAPPAGRVQPRQGEVIWLIDRAAASLLRQLTPTNE